MKKLLLILFCLPLSILAFCQESVFVSVIVETIELPTDKRVYIRGNHTFLGSWTIGQVRLQRRSANEWAGIFIFNKGDKLSMLFDLGSDKTAAVQNGELKDTAHFEISDQKEIRIFIEEFKGSELLDEPQCIYHKFPGTVPSGLKDRMVVIRTPAGYEEDSLSTYPVIYFQHGDELFEDDPKRKGLEWRMDEVLDSLVKDSIIRPCIVVSILSLDDTQTLEYADSDIGDRYRKYLSQHLKPLITDRFRVSSDPKDHVLMGHGASAFAGFLTAWEYPNVFGSVSCMSAPFKIFENNIFERLDAHEGPSKDIRLYLDIGEFGYDEKYKPGFDDVIEYLEQNGYSFQQHFEENSIQKIEHFRKRLWRPIVQFLAYPE